VCDIKTTECSARRHRGAVRGIVAILAAAALVAPAAAGAKPSLLAQAKAAVRQTNAQEETHHLIPFKRNTKFTITCRYQGTNVLCMEHAGPERCVNGKPWISLSDLFPIIKGRLGESLTYGLTLTTVYCKH
jgi:hypothetical protein